MTQDLRSARIVFVGAGSMAEAIVKGLLEQKKTEPRMLTMLNRSQPEKLERLQKAYGIAAAVNEQDKQTAIRQADIVVLAMKPKDAAEAIEGIRGLLNPSQLIVSVIAGLSIDSIVRLAGQDIPVARTMPNTSSTIGLGASGISFSRTVKDTGKKIALDMFRSVGIVAEVEEHLLDTVTGVSGSGPAYIYYMMEAMIRAGVEGGLAEEASRELTVQTVLGAARMVTLTGEQPAELRRKVTSPGGTTQAALESLDRDGFPDAVQRAVLRAAERAREMGEKIASSIGGQTN